MFDFIKNNLTIFVSVAIAFISACFNIYQYISNKQLKKYNAEKELKKKKADLEKLINDYNHSNYEILIFPEDVAKRENGFNHKKKYFEAEIEYLEKILKIKNK